jgi:hypothetical protein
MDGDLILRLRAAGLVVAAVVALNVTPRPALTAEQVHDEIEVYNAEIAEVGQWTIEQHLNYAWRGQTQPEFPGAFVSNRSLQGTPEFAYGLTDWWEAGFYLPFAVNSAGEVLSDGAKIRSLFVTPNAANRSFFYGVNFELGYEMPQFSSPPWGLEIRPIIGVRNTQWEFIVNPIVDWSFGPLAQAEFAPAVRLARNLGEDRYIGLEYYADFGPIGNFLPLSEQSQQIFAVTDFKLAKFDIELGVGYGLTPGSDRLITKAIIGYAFPVPGKGNDEAGDHATMAPMVTKAGARQLGGGIGYNPLALR